MNRQKEPVDGSIEYQDSPRQVAGSELQLFCDVIWLTTQLPGAAMNDAEQPSPELYRLAQKLRELADQSHLPDIQADLRQLAARFDRMATEFEARRRLGSARNGGKA